MSESSLFAFYAFFVCVKCLHKKIERLEISLITPFILLLEYQTKIDTRDLGNQDFLLMLLFKELEDHLLLLLITLLLMFLIIQLTILTIES